MARMQPQVGFFGCAGADRIVKLGPPRSALADQQTLMRMKARSFRFQCPACGDVHVTKPLWRPRRAGGETVELNLTKEMEVASSAERRRGMTTAERRREDARKSLDAGA